MKVYTYYQHIDFKNQEELISLWRSSWEKYGFEPIVLGIGDAKNHPGYEVFTERVKTISQKIVNQPLNNYGLSCWLRWLAYATQPEEKFYVCDYDVINHNFFPKEPDDLLHLMDSDCPCIASGTPSQFNELCNKFIEVPNENMENFIRTFQTFHERKLRHFHDQEFFSIYCFKLKLNKGDIKLTRERDTFLSSPSKENFWKRELVHYSHADCEQYSKKYNIKHDDSTRLRLIEEHLTLSYAGERFACKEPPAHGIFNKTFDFSSEALKK